MTVLTHQDVIGTRVPDTLWGGVPTGPRCPSPPGEGQGPQPWRHAQRRDVFGCLPTAPGNSEGVGIAYQQGADPEVATLFGGDVVPGGLSPASQAANEAEGGVATQGFREPVAETERGEGNRPAARDQQANPSHIPDGQGVGHDGTLTGKTWWQSQHGHESQDG